jgi:LPS-assembly protein
VLGWEKIRHEIKPEITYSYIPNIKQNGIPDFTPNMMSAAAATTTLVTPPIGVPITEQNAVTVALTNTFTAKIPEIGGSSSYLEFLRVKLFETYDINEANKSMLGVTTERRPLSDIGMEVDVKPHKYFSFAARNIYNVYAGWKETNYDLHISDYRDDNLTVGYRYTIDAIQEINFDLKAVITKFIDARFIVRRDQLNSRTIENTVGLLYHQQCWAVGFDFTKTDTDTLFVLKLSLTGIGKF